MEETSTVQECIFFSNLRLGQVKLVESCMNKSYVISSHYRGYKYFENFKYFKLLSLSFCSTFPQIKSLFLYPFLSVGDIFASNLNAIIHPSKLVCITYVIKQVQFGPFYTFTKKEYFYKHPTSIKDFLSFVLVFSTFFCINKIFY